MFTNEPYQFHNRIENNNKVSSYMPHTDLNIHIACKIGVRFTYTLNDNLYILHSFWHQNRMNVTVVLKYLIYSETYTV